MHVSGRIIRGSISSTDENSVWIYTTYSGPLLRHGAVEINIVINGQIASNSIPKPQNTRTRTILP